MNQLGDPLKNTLILDNIFARLGLETQKQFRLVNRTWENASVGKWRKSALVLIDMEEDEKIEGDKKGMEEFLKLWNADGDPANSNSIIRKPFRRFRLFRWSQRNFFGCRSSVMIQDFWRLCSPQMESLEFVHFHCKERFIPAIKWILLEEERSELKELSLYGCVFISNPREELNAGVFVSCTAKKLALLRLNNCFEKTETGTGSFAGIVRYHGTELLQMVPNLKVLLLPSSVSQYFMKALVSSATTMDNPIRLETLEICRDGLEPLLDYVKLAKPALKKLKIVNIYITDLQESPYNFQMLMDHCSSTLEEIEINLPRIPDSFMTDFSGREFPKLKELKINTDEKGIKFDFMSLFGMPSLKVCKISNYYKLPAQPAEYFTEEDLTYEGKDEWMGNVNNFDISKLHLDHLEEFHFRMHKSFSVDALRKVGSWMKNVEEVALVLNKETFPVAVEQWPNLQKLTLLKGSTVPQEEIDQAQKINKYLLLLNVSKTSKDLLMKL